MRFPLPYTVKNNLQKFLKMEQARRVLQNGTKVNLIEIEKEVGEYCNLTREAIFSIKRGTSIASLPVALKLAEFFNTTIEQMFVLKDKDYNSNNQDVDYEENNECIEVEMIESFDEKEYTDEEQEEEIEQMNLI